MKIRALIALTAGAMALTVASAQPSTGCDPQTFLLVTGKINGGQPKHLTEKAVLALSRSDIVTSTAWTEKSKFSGVKFSDLMKSLGATGTKYQVTGLDNYTAAIKISDVNKYEPILAYERDGKRLDRAQHGPMFIIFPRDRYPNELNTPAFQMQYVWQTCRIDVG